MEPSEEIAHITSQVAALDNKISELYKERAKRLQRLNHIRCPIISRFPSEVLSHIFGLSTHTDPDKPRTSSRKILFKLRAVCSHWHRVVESSPQLWTTLTLSDDWRLYFHDNPSELLVLVRYYLQRLGGVAMSLDINGQFVPLLGDILRLVLKDHPRQLKSLHFREMGSRGLPEAWPVILEYADVKLSRFEEFELDVGRGDSGQWGKDALFRNCPRLRTLSFGGREISLQFPWKQITTLKLNGAYLRYSFNLLSLCPNLATFESSKGDEDNSSWDPPQRQMVVSMHSLRDLVWIPGSHEHLESREKLKPVKLKSPKYQFFLHFRFPAVRKLHWNFPLPSDAHSIRDFFANMQELEELRIHPSRCKYRIDQYLNLFGSLTTLIIDIVGNMDRWLWRLTIKPGNSNLIPRLQRLHLNVDGVQPPMLTLVLYSRRNGPVDWLEFKRDTQYEEIILSPYDPTSTHWHRYARLLEFSTQPYNANIGKSLQFDWTRAHYDALKAMMLEAKTVEGFGERSNGQNRILF